VLSSLALLVAACGGSSGGDTTTRQRVLVIHSYDNEFRWTAEQGRGIVEGLRRAGLDEGEDYQLRVFFMETRVTYTTPDQIEERASRALDIISEFDPDIVFVTDDVALKDVAVAFTQFAPQRELPFIFSGINADPTVYPPVRSLAAPGGLITGTLERIPFDDTFATVERVIPSAQRIAIYADDSASSTAVLEEYRRTHTGVATALDVVALQQISTFAEWQRTIMAVQTQADIIGLVNYHRVKDETGRTVPAREVAQWTIANSRVPVVALVSDWAADGIFMAVGNSGFKTGTLVGIIGGEVLQGKAPGTIAIVDPHLVETAFNLTTADSKSITIPPAELVNAGQVYR
jgi:ABC-type uncharacterized transport system substrate-binding protein